MLENRVIALELEYGATVAYKHDPEVQRPVPLNSPLLTRMIRRHFRTRRSGPVLLGSMASNGARLYVDHSHPEYANPETTSINEALEYDYGGESLVSDVFEDAMVEKPDEEEGYRASQIADYTLTRRVASHTKSHERDSDDSDLEQGSWGAHGGAQALRSAIDQREVRGKHARAWAMWGLHVATREAVTGSGGIYVTDSGDYEMGVAQKGVHLTTAFSTRTTYQKPVVNLRDIPYANRDKYVRIHDTSGDANVFARPKYIRIGSTILTLGLIEEEIWPALPDGFEFDDDELVALALHTAKDTTCKKPFKFKNGYRATPVEIGNLFVEATQKLVDRGLLNDELLLARRLWEHDLGQLAIDPILLFWDNEWVTRKALLSKKYAGDMRAKQVPWGRALPADIAFDRILPASEESFLRNLRQKVALREARKEPNMRVNAPSAEAMARSLIEPPSNTRAYDRGRLVQHFVDRGGEADGGAGWQTLQVKYPFKPVELSDDPRVSGHPEAERILSGQWRRNT